MLKILPNDSGWYIPTKELSDFALENWPKDRPRPTAEQVAQAESRMIEQVSKDRASGYQGDWGFGLDFLMATYAPFCWLHLFFPDEEFEPEIERKI